jgi:hypothetical protein
MSIENGDRFLRQLESDLELRKKVLSEGREAFEKVSAEAGASCSAYDAVAAFVKRLDRERRGE